MGRVRAAKAFSQLVVQPDSVVEAVKELRLDNEAIADQVETTLGAIEERRKQVADTFAANADLPPGLPDFPSVHAEVSALATQLQERVTMLPASYLTTLCLRLTIVGAKALHAAW